MKVKTTVKAGTGNSCPQSQSAFALGGGALSPAVVFQTQQC